MRKFIGSLGAAAVLVGCATFGSDEPTPPEEQLAPPSNPQDNSKPPAAPVDGTPIAGVYVSSSLGTDDGLGTLARPLKTLKKAFAVAHEQQLRVIACAETYEEPLVLLDGVSAYGYYDCSATAWPRVNRRALVRSPTSPAAVAKGLSQPVRLEGFSIYAPDLGGRLAKDGPNASVALEVRDSSQLTIGESLLHGGTGPKGQDGVEGPNNIESGTRSGASGTFQATYPCNAQVEAVPCDKRTTNPGGRGGTSSCAFGPSGGPGGTGGDGEWFNPNPTTAAARDVRGRPFAATLETSAGGGEAASAFAGASGAHGGDGTNGAWSLTAAGFAVGDGTAGDNGSPGQGSGGGGGNHFYRCAGVSGPCSPGGSPTYWYSTSGTGGGAGACPGIAGTAGTGGGATLGALIVQSVVTFERTRIETDKAGDGGKGTLGSAGLSGSPTVFGAKYGGAGLSGGDGGWSGLSGHGAPGPAIAMVYAGARPVTATVDFAPGPGGAPLGELRKTFDDPVIAKVLPAVSGQSLAEYEIK